MCIHPTLSLFFYFYDIPVVLRGPYGVLGIELSQVRCVQNRCPTYHLQYVCGSNLMFIFHIRIYLAYENVSREYRPVQEHTENGLPSLLIDGMILQLSYDSNARIISKFTCSERLIFGKWFTYYLSKHTFFLLFKTVDHFCLLAKFASLFHCCLCYFCVYYIHDHI